MVKKCFCIIFLSTLHFIDTAPLQMSMRGIEMDENNLVEIEKVLKSIQNRFHQLAPDHVHKEGHGVSNHDLALPDEEPESSKLFYMLYIGEKPENSICDNEKINENYTIEGYNNYLKCKCRFCIRNMIDKNYEERCFPDPCEIESVEDGSDTEDGETQEDGVFEALNDIKKSFAPETPENETDDRNPMPCESKPCDRPDMDEINRLRCRRNGCHFRFI